MAKEIIETPLWILEQIDDQDLKIGLVIVELPEHKTLEYIDLNGHFQPAILNQLLQVLMMMRGEPMNGALMNAEAISKFPEFQVGEDLILLQFQKHYFGSTQTACIPLSKIAEEKAYIFSDHMMTNQYFQEANFLLKYNLNIILEPNNIAFSLNGFGDSDIEETEVAKVKATIL